MKFIDGVEQIGALVEHDAFGPRSYRRRWHAAYLYAVIPTTIRLQPNGRH